MTGIRFMREMEMKTEKLPKSLKKDFSALTEIHKKKVIEMTRFLVLTQNNIIPEMLNSRSYMYKSEKKKGSVTMKQSSI